MSAIVSSASKVAVKPVTIHTETLAASIPPESADMTGAESNPASYYNQAADTAAPSIFDAPNEFVASWSEPVLKAYLDFSHGSQHTEVIDNMHETQIFNDWTSEKLRRFLEKPPRKSSLDGLKTRDELVEEAQDQYKRLSTDYGPQHSLIISFLMQRKGAIEDEKFWNWSEDELKVFLKAFGAEGYEKLSRENLKAEAKKHFHYFKCGTFPSPEYLSDQADTYDGLIAPLEPHVLDHIMRDEPMEPDIKLYFIPGPNANQGGKVPKTTYRYTQPTTATYHGGSSVTGGYQPPKSTSTTYHDTQSTPISYPNPKPASTAYYGTQSTPVGYRGDNPTTGGYQTLKPASTTHYDTSSIPISYRNPRPTPTAYYGVQSANTTNHDPKSSNIQGISYPQKQTPVPGHHTLTITNHRRQT